MTQKARVVIHYCTLCQWQLRAAWMAQELLQTFTDEILEVALRPGEGGVFTINVNDVCIWDRKTEGGFPAIKELKQRFAAQACPDKPLARHLSDNNKETN